ncbi:PREDICTED: protein argonaute 6 [Tarenaya hassleriana]|uniref:protein argonaute 6 n=1 Tax=Tarenaya hassleriana TaxID=28532 RepID=UPI00053C4A04|nr:PREDICTED: protein argonaute 6 [Tarenaya hassleriana]XP_010556973.1 PREDICTED: protein argonaute 6 [Tarenaya hassleriana]XP_010556974.1 PREDICTED: protein argonaute 6 [Tarenaya hassleriana]
MERSNSAEAGESQSLPPPPNDTKPDRPSHRDYAITTRRGIGSNGNRISLLANHFNVSVKSQDIVFYQYTVNITTEDGKSFEGKGVSRKLIDKLYQTYSSELASKELAYDGEKTLYTVGPLPRNDFDFIIVMEDTYAKSERQILDVDGPADTGKRSKHSLLPRNYRVQIHFATKIPLKTVFCTLKGADGMDKSTQDALRVLDIVLRQHAAKRGCLLVRQSFFSDTRHSVDVGGGVTGIRGFHSSFRPTHGGLSLNIDSSTTMILKPGPVIDFLLANQNVKEARQIDWIKARNMLRHIRVKAIHRNMEFKIIGLSEKPCNQQSFSMKVKGGGSEERTLEITVYDYFKQGGIELTYSAYMPCLDVGKPKRPNYLPLELCELVSLQRYTKALSGMQRASLVEKSRQKPPERIRTINDALDTCHYDDDPFLAACGISIEKRMTQVEGRTLSPPMLKFGKNDDFLPRNGRWNFNNKVLLQPSPIYKWLVVNFSARCDTSHISRELINCGRRKGVDIDRPFALFEEDPQSRRMTPVKRVEKMFEQMKAKLPDTPYFILCVLPERKNCDIYGPWKKKCLVDFGINTQCICPTKVNDQYLTNVLLKINSKLGGINSLLRVEHSSNIPLINDIPTMILGMDVSHGSPGRADTPSIAAVVGSKSWPLISRYRAAVRSQSPKLEMIDSLFKPIEDRDEGIMNELFREFYMTSKGRKPKQIIIFRDGVSESQFNQVLNIEVDQVIKAYQHFGETDVPKFTVIVAQKNHHTKLFLSNGADNVPAGTVVDTKVVHPRHYDFYMCAHAGIIGTSRPAHYHVLLDEIGFSPDDLQSLIHSLSYVYQRSTSAISIVAPVRYAHLAAAQVAQFIKFEDLSEAGSDSGRVQDLPSLHKHVESSMFFC